MGAQTLWSQEGNRRKKMQFTQFQSSELGPPPPYSQGSVAPPPLGPRVRPQSKQSVKLYLRSSELGPQPPQLQGSVVPLPLGPKGGGTLACGVGGGGDRISIKGQTLVIYVYYNHSTNLPILYCSCTLFLNKIQFSHKDCKSLELCFFVG
jgi:hypothetical protein